MKKKRTPKKPDRRQEIRPYPGFSVRITIEPGAPTPACLKNLMLKKGAA